MTMRRHLNIVMSSFRIIINLDVLSPEEIVTAHCVAASHQFDNI